MVVIRFPDGMGRQLRAARRQRGVSLEALGQRVHLDAGTLSRLEREVHPAAISLDLVAACAAALNDPTLIQSARALVSAAVAGDLHAS